MLALNLSAADPAVRRPDASENQSEIVVDFSRRRNRRAGITAGTALLDRYRRGKSFDMFDLGLLHLLEELSGICTERLDIFTLALGIDCVKRQ